MPGVFNLLPRQGPLSGTLPGPNGATTEAQGQPLSFLGVSESPGLKPPRLTQTISSKASLLTDLFYPLTDITHGFP